MSSITCLYFDGAVVQAVDASFSAGRLAVLDAQSFPRHELERFLARSRQTRFIACCNPALFYQHTLELPPAASGHYHALVRTEISKLHPEIASFSSLYAVVGQTTTDHKVFNRVATFSYDDASHHDLLESFSRRGKELRRLYPAPYPLFRLGASACTGRGGARLFVAAVPGEKLLLVGEDSRLRFVRKMPSAVSSAPTGESQTIRMTLDFCAETLGVSAAEVVVLAGPAEAADLIAEVPVKQLMPAALAHLPADLVSSFLAPLAGALHFFENPADGDILPAQYRSFSSSRSFLSRASLAFTVLAVLAGSYAVHQSIAVARLEKSISRLRAEMAGAGNELADYRKLDSEAMLVQRRLALVQKESPAAALAAVSRLQTEGFSLKAISAQSEAGIMKVRISGDIQASGFSDAQTAFEGLLRQVGRLEGFTVTSSALQMKARTFELEARYLPGGRKG